MTLLSGDYPTSQDPQVSIQFIEPLPEVKAVASHGKSPICAWRGHLGFSQEEVATRMGMEP